MSENVSRRVEKCPDGSFELVTRSPLPDLAAAKRLRDQLKEQVVTRRMMLERMEADLANAEVALEEMEKETAN